MIDTNRWLDPLNVIQGLAIGVMVFVIVPELWRWVMGLDSLFGPLFGPW